MSTVAKKLTVLIIEDDVSNSELAVDLLTVAGYETLAVSSAEEGVILSRSRKPDLVLMDLSLPGMDGISATRILKSDPRTCDIPVIAVTAHTLGGTQNAVRAAGCCSYIAKPIDTRSFASLVGSALSTRSEAISECTGQDQGTVDV